MIRYRAANLNLQKKEATKYNDFEIEPLDQPLNDLEKEFQNFIFLKAIDEDGCIVGSTRGYIADSTSYIGKTVVHPNNPIALYILTA